MDQVHWLRALYEANFTTIYRLVSYRLWTYTGSSADAQDIVQEVFLLAYRKDIRCHAKPEAWLMKTADNLCRNHARTRNRQEQKQKKAAKDVPMLSGETEIRDVDMKLTLESIVSSDDYEIIVKHYMFGQSLEEIAQQMGVSHAALRVRLFRIRKRLKEFFPDV